MPPAYLHFKVCKMLGCLKCKYAHFIFISRCLTIVGASQCLRLLDNIAGRMEAEKNVKKHQQAIAELRTQLEEEHSAREEAAKQVCQLHLFCNSCN